MDILEVLGVRRESLRAKRFVEALAHENSIRKLTQAIIVPHADFPFDYIEPGYNPMMSVRRDLSSGSQNDDVGSDVQMSQEAKSAAPEVHASSLVRRTAMQAEFDYVHPILIRPR